MPNSVATLASAPGRQAKTEIRRKSSRGNAVGALRFFFALAVIYSHSYFLGGHGPEAASRWLFANREFCAGLAVKGFFVLSGMLIVRSELRLDDTWRFLWHRCVRIYPALWACLIVTAFVFAPLIDHGSDRWSAPAAFEYVWRNLLDPRGLVSIGGLPTNTPWSGDINGSLWTLEYEIACYLVVAFVGWTGMLRLRRFAWLLPVLILAVYMRDRMGAQTPLFFKISNRDVIAYFAAGSLAALLPFDLRPRPAATLLAIAIVALLANYRLPNPYLLSPLLLTIAIVACTKLACPSLESAVGGDYSYGLYIYAYPIQQTLASFALHKQGVFVFFLASATLTLGIAAVSWHALEKRALALKDVVVSPRRERALAERQ